MPNYLASYDLKETNPDPHSTFLAESRKRGWNYWVLSSSNTWYRLPNTTLVGNFDSMSAAEKALEDTRVATAAAIGRAVTMEKWIIVGYSQSRFNSDVTQNK
jgi:exonuclease I